MSIFVRPQGTGSSGSSSLQRVRGVWKFLPFLLVVVLAVVGTSNKGAALIASALVVLLAVVLLNPTAICIIAIPGCLLLGRIGGGAFSAAGAHGSTVSTSDLLTFLGSIVALTLMRWDKTHYVRRMLLAVVLYMGVLLVVLANNPNHDDAFEWLHRLAITGGSILIGWVVVERGMGRVALRMLLWGSAILGVIAIFNSLAHGLAPAQWGAYQKNPLGDFMWMAVVVAQVNPPWGHLNRKERNIISLICLVALIMTHSRQSWVSLVVAFAVTVLLQPNLFKRSKNAVVAIIVFGGMAYGSLKAELGSTTGFSTINIRSTENSGGMEIYHLSPILGEGLRYYYRPQFAYFSAPPSVIVDALSTSGIVGLISLIVFVILTVRAAAKMPRVVGAMAVGLLVAHFIAGLFDVFWLGANGALPFMLVGMCFGAADTMRWDPEFLARSHLDLGGDFRPEDFVSVPDRP